MNRVLSEAFQNVVAGAPIAFKRIAELMQLGITSEKEKVDDIKTEGLQYLKY